MTFFQKKRNDNSRVLIVEENISDRRLLCRILRKKNFKIEIADEFSISEKVANNNFNLIIIGSVLNQRSLDLCVELNNCNDSDRPPILVITEKGSDPNIVEYYMQNVEYCLIKPISEKELINQVGVLLNK